MYIKKLFWLICFTVGCYYNIIISNATEPLKVKVEEIIQQDLNLNNVVVYFSNFNRYENINFDQEIKINYKNNNRFSFEIIKPSGFKEVVQGKFEEAKMIPALSKNILKGQEITEDSLTQIKVAKNYHNDKFVQQPEEIIGKYANYNLEPYKLIPKNGLKSFELVKKGQGVKLVFTKNSLYIESSGITMQSGSINDIIRVRNTNSNKIVQGKIINSETVLVNY
jgi:flagella basal body P-ring formation protein FlgA